jgi:hypothetical protein
LSSLAGTWLNQRGRLRAQLRAQELAKREALYVEFITEASRSLAEAVTHQTEDPAVIVGLYADVERMRLMSPDACCGPIVRGCIHQPERSQAVPERR